MSVGRLPSHSQKQKGKHDENPKTLHAEASYLSLSPSKKIHTSDVRDRWVHLQERLMKQVHRCTRILILSLLPVSVFVPIFLLSNTLRHFNSGNQRITIVSWKDFIVSLSVLLVRYCLCVKYLIELVLCYCRIGRIYCRFVDDCMTLCFPQNCFLFGWLHKNRVDMRTKLLELFLRTLSRLDCYIYIYIKSSLNIFFKLVKLPNQVQTSYYSTRLGCDV